MIRLNIYEIKTQLSKYIDLVEAGETVLVCKRNIPVAEIRSIEKIKQKRKPVLGWAEGQGKIAPSFDEPLSRVELQLWEGDAGDPLKKYAPSPAKRRK